MSVKQEPISVRTTRLNNLILGNSKATSKTCKNVSDALSREGLLDALFVLYNECNKDSFKKHDKNIHEFTSKYRPIIQEANSLRVSSDDFKNKAQIGKGFFGNVYLVEEKTTGDIYAMKKIKKCGITNSQVKEERDIMARRNSEWITSLQYAFQDLDCLYLVMEYLPGGDLLSLMIRNGPFDEELAKFYLAELTLALNALHSMGYVHRDIKPENILIDRFGHIKLGDFGNAAALDKYGYVTSLSPVGTPDYIAPELLQTISSSKQSKSVHDVKCDFWSMGVIGYELIFETTPFHEENVYETYSKILSHCDDTNPEIISYPTNIKISPTFKSLIESLIIKPSVRLTYAKIVKHPFFEDINWDKLRQQAPPIIPTVNGNDDISNFEDIERNKGRRSTFVKKMIIHDTKSNEFTGKNLPFLGYGFIHEETINDEFVFKCDENQVSKLNNKIKELYKVNKVQNDEIKILQEKLLKVEHESLHSDSLSKVIKDSKEELNKIKDKLKEKTIELASCRTEIKTLKSSLKIEEEMRLKNEATIAEVLSSTYQKWEKAKMNSDQNYEKRISEKKTEISNITQKLLARENELSTKSEECVHLQKKIDNYKEMLKSIKEQNAVDKVEFEKAKKQMIDTYEAKILELAQKLKIEKECKSKLNSELRDVRNELDESICSTNSSKQAKLVTERNMEVMKERLNKEVELNTNLTSQNAALQKQLSDSEKNCVQLRNEIEKLKQEIQLIEYSKTIQFDEHASPYHTAHGSLTELSTVEEQLRNDLQIAKEQEDIQKKRANKLEKVVEELETLVEKLKEQPKAVGDLLEKKNEKLEDQLASAREEAIIERQRARSANLSLYKLEKQVEDLTQEKKVIQRKLDAADEKVKKLQNEKGELDRKLKESQDIIKRRESRITELQADITNLKSDLQKEHKMWEKSEQERMKEKSENIENVSRVNKMNEKIEEFKQKFMQLSQRNDGLNLENKRLMRELNDERGRTSSITDELNNLQIKLKTCEKNYDLLKMACNVTDTQLTEVEVMLETEQKLNKANQEKIDKLWKSIREKDEIIAKLKQSVDVEIQIKTTNEMKLRDIQTEQEKLKKNLEDARQQIITQQNELIKKTSKLFETQEEVEVLTSELSNLQSVNSNYEKQIILLKEEMSKILSDLYMTKEEASKLSRDLKSASHYITELKQEIEQLNGTLTEQKNYYMQREVKSEATLVQHKKLIDYLQIKVEDLSQKKKKSLADKIFGGSTIGSAKKENISPNVIESSIMYRTLQEELKREKKVNKQLKDELEKLKVSNVEKIKEVSHQSPIKEIVKSTETVNATQNEPQQLQEHQQPQRKVEDSVKGTISVTSNKSDQSKGGDQIHRFELTLEKSEANCGVCIGCQKPIIAGSPYFCCKECKQSVHRKCRGGVQTTCEGFEAIIQMAPSKCSDEEISVECLSTEDNAQAMLSLDTSGNINEIVLKSNITSPPLEINCVFDILQDIILIGCKTGLFAYHFNTKSLVNIVGINSVLCITVTQKLSKAILIGENGQYLYQCDLRHLQNRAQANACLKPKLEASVLDLPFANRTVNEKWHLAKISNESNKAIDTVAIAATSTRIVIMKYDLNLQRFKPVRALDCAMAVSSILFTRHTAIVGSDKFFEIDLSMYTAEEFVDMSDSTLAHMNNCQPINIFRISPQEFLLCFVECGIFVDEYGCRSRPYDLNWEYTPTGFIYQEPLLYISHFQIVQILRIHRSYRNEVALTRTSDSEDEQNFLRGYINMYTPSLLAECGKRNVYVLATENETNLQELSIIDGVKVIKSNTNVSLESLSSEGTCLTLDSMGPSLSSA